MKSVSQSFDINKRILDDSVYCLERTLCLSTGANHAVVVENGYQGLVLALQVAGILPGDRVVLPALARTEVLQAITSLSAEPLFVDINPNTYLLDPFCLDYLVGRCIRTDEPLPKAIICCNLFGSPCSYSNIEATCQEHGITLIEDATQSLGASIDNRNSGTFGRMSVVSVLDEGYVSLGEDGAVLCHSEEDADALHRLRHGFCTQLQIPSFSDHSSFINTELVREKLNISHQEQDSRKRIALYYQEALYSSTRIQQTRKNAYSAWREMAVLLPDDSIRDEVIVLFAKEQIPTSIPFDLPLHHYTIYGGRSRIALINAASVYKRLLCLPLHPYLTKRVIEQICGLINKTCASAREEILISRAV